MNLQDEVRLSFYKEIADIDKRHNVVLVQHVDTGKVYVKKALTHYDTSVFEFIKNGRFPGIPIIHELIESNGTLIVIEDYINGHSLEELLESKLFNVEDARAVVLDLCDILQPLHMHHPPIIHRDIKCSNVIIDNEGDVYLIDFDASKQVAANRNRDTDLIGTEPYAAPEQYGFGQSDQRTDIYALGILLHKLLTGKFPSETHYVGTFSHAIAKATAIDPANRFQNVTAFKTAIGNSACEQPQSDSGLKRMLSRLPYPIRELPGFRSGNPLFFILALLGYLLIFSFGFIIKPDSTNYTPAQDRFYNIATFFIIIVPTLYLGNYLGIRDRLPWQASSRKSTNVIRICIGTFVSLLLVFAVFTLIALILDY